MAPAVYGMFRPVMLLPAGYTDSPSREEVEHALLHELAEIGRKESPADVYSVPRDYRRVEQLTLEDF